MAFYGVPGDPPGVNKITMVTPPAKPWYPWVSFPVAFGQQTAPPPPSPTVADPPPPNQGAAAFPGKKWPLQYDPTTGGWKAGP